VGWVGWGGVGGWVELPQCDVSSGRGYRGRAGGSGGVGYSSSSAAATRGIVVRGERKYARGLHDHGSATRYVARKLETPTCVPCRHHGQKNGAN
jgi:hypothetical protein